MSYRHITTTVMLLAAVALIVTEVIAIFSRAPGDTISEVIWDYSAVNPIITFVAGVICGHLFWPRSTKYKLPFE